MISYLMSIYCVGDADGEEYFYRDNRPDKLMALKLVSFQRNKLRISL